MLPYQLRVGADCKMLMLASCGSCDASQETYICFVVEFHLLLKTDGTISIIAAMNYKIKASTEMCGQIFMPLLKRY